jgi:hypothetical protein
VAGYSFIGSGINASSPKSENKLGPSNGCPAISSLNEKSRLLIFVEPIKDQSQKIIADGF